MRADTYQILLILAGLLVTALLSIFLFREINPEYRLYQDHYLALEDFRSTYTHQPPPPFKIGVKQIVIEQEDRGPAIIDRCTSCHVALQVPDFSPTKIAYDLNGNILRDPDGHPLLVANENYVWDRLEQKITELRDEKVNEQLTSEGKTNEVQTRLREADRYESLKTATVGESIYDVRKVLQMHPLIGKETRPFEFHSMDEYGCTSCHSGNGRGLTTSKAHGPVFDEQYETEFRGVVPKFTEPDPDNDPLFARMFNAKPGHDLLFQTTPILIGSLIQSKCIQCHQTTAMQLEQTHLSVSEIDERQQKKWNILQDAYENEIQTLLSILNLKEKLVIEGYKGTIEELKQKTTDYTLSPQELTQASSQLNYLEKSAGNHPDEQIAKNKILERLNQDLIQLLGSWSLAKSLQEVYDQQGEKGIDPFLTQHLSNPQATGSLFIKRERLRNDLQRHVLEESFKTAVTDQKTLSSLETDVDALTRNFQRGKEQYFTQACYACHRIAGLARGGVGPELTRIGESYPWYIKESIIWPQADLKNSTMPNMRLDHQEVEDLMTFLLGQRGNTQAISQTSYQSALRAWEGGRKQPWEQPISPAQIYDVRNSMIIFAVEGCASCHRLEGYESNVGFKGEKENASFNQLYEQRQWFRQLFPEVIRFSQYEEPLSGSEIVKRIEQQTEKIDEQIVGDVRKNGILEEINEKHPEVLESLYSNFRYAFRAKDHAYRTRLKHTQDEEEKKQIRLEHQAWKDRVDRVFMMYIQEYGLGRLIGPHLNWSGIYRSDQWLMEHFYNPSGHVPRSIMPVFPFDHTKFYALTYMLDVLSIRNRKRTRQIWEHRGFSPQEAYQIHCAQCHGQNLEGTGPISEWIYPIPKNLRNADFLRHLTKERAIFSIIHGVKGTPMPPWGEVGKDKPVEIREAIESQSVLTEAEIKSLVDWIFASLPGGEVLREPIDVLKWNYQPEDVLEELLQEGGSLKPLPEKEQIKKEELLPERPLPQENVPEPADESVFSYFPTTEVYYAAIRPELYPKPSPEGAIKIDQVEDVFDKTPNPPDSSDPFNYFIKKKFYTPYNLQEGQKFFLLNCAVCHGNEGDGSGSRATVMQEAKPRMLTNLDWIRTRDDLRLLRSIKYGVPGTSMVAWGDQTNSLQRLQLVMFIRTLNREQDRRDKLLRLLYEVYETAVLLVEKARADESRLIQQMQEQQTTLINRQAQLEALVAEGKLSNERAIKNYQEHLQLTQNIHQLQKKDTQFVELIQEIRREKELYQNLGLSLISKDLNEELLENYLKWIELNKDRYSIENGQLALHMNEEQEKRMRQLQTKLVHTLNEKIEQLQAQQKILQGKFSTAQRNEELTTNRADLLAYQKLKASVISTIEEAIRSIEKQHKLIKLLKQVKE